MDHSENIHTGGSSVLVTGASGFLGRHLVQFLSRQGHVVRALYNQTPPSKDLLALPGLTWMQCDLLDIFDVEEAMKGITHIYHCAAIVSFHPAEKQKMLHFNVESTVNVVNEALLHNVRKLLFVSSIAALGRSETSKEISEEEQWEESRYNSRYGLSKHLAELEVWRGAGEGLKAVIINPGIILGAGNWDEGSARLIKIVDKEFPFYTRGVNAWVDVRDVVQVMTRLMDSEIKDERIIVSAGNYSYKEIFTRMALALGRKPPHIKAGPLLTGLVWRWSLFRSRLFGETATITRETANTSQKQSFYKNTKLLDLLPQFNYRNMEDTIAHMALMYQNDKEGRV
jgi:nucleoside-diphosphate-sugar epimerase